MSEDKRPLSTDELIEQMEREEADGATKLSPREYGRLRGIKPQLVYYYIRTGKIKIEQCICGRNVIDVQAADSFFAGDGGGTEAAEQEDV